MTTASATAWKVGDRARFIGKDRVFYGGEREGKVGTIVADADGDEHGSNFGIMLPVSSGTCGWKVDGGDGVFITGLDDLERM